MIRVGQPSGSVLQVDGPCGAGMRARRRGNFLLQGQKKVTKEEALNRIPAPQAQATPCDSQQHSLQKRAAALSRLTCHDLHPSHQNSVRRAAGRRALQNSPTQRRSGDAAAALRRPSDAAFADEPGVQPALSGVKVRSGGLVTGTAARAQRVASGRNAADRFRAPLLAVSRSCAVERLFFGDFLLAPQKKVTALPGAHPGTALANKQK